MSNTTSTKATDYKISLRSIRLSDYNDIKETMDLCYAGIPEPAWELVHLKKLLKLFPEGQICIEVNKKVVACALALIVDYAKYGDNHTYKQITDDYNFSTHDPEGDTLYGIDIFVHPDYRAMRLGRRLYDARKELCENLNLSAIVAGGRIPRYTMYAKEMTPKEYIQRVESKEIYDPILSFQLSNGFHVRKILKNYLNTDRESRTYATLI